MKKISVAAFLSLSFLLAQLTNAQQIQPEKIIIGNPHVVNFSQLAQWEAAHPLPIGEPRSIEDKEKNHRGMPGDQPVPADATKSYVNLEAPQAAPPSPTPLITFPGLLDNGGGYPPDVIGTVGTTDIMQTLNTQFRILTKAGATISTLTITTFFSATGGHGYFDPRIQYDPFNNRWLIVMSGNLANGHGAFFVAISQTSDPTGSWYLYSVDATGSSTSYLDYPTLGFNKNWVVVTGGVFSTSGFFSTTKIFVLQRANLYSGNAGTVFSFSDANVFVLQPAVSIDSTVNTEYMVEKYNSNTGGFGYVKLYSITGTVGAPVYSGIATVGVNQPWSSSTVGAPQLGSTHTIDMGDDRCQVPTYRGGLLYVSQNAFLPSTSPKRCSSQWWVINVSNNTVSQFGRVDDATNTNFYGYPAISVNSQGDFLVGYSTFSASIYASCGYSFHAFTDPPNTTQTPYVFKAGFVPYYKVDGSGRNRWGDYSATCVDPTNNTFWTVAEYAYANSNKWGTYFANVAASQSSNCPTPTGLTASNINSISASLSWNAATGAVGYNIQYHVVGSGTWTSVSSSTNSYTLTGLSASTNYEYEVQTDCGGGNVSSYSGPFQFSTPACTDIYEPNNSKGKAKAIPVNSPIAALITPSGDLDYFSFSNTASQPNIEVNLTNLPDDYDLTLFGPSGTKIGQSKNTGFTNEQIKYNTSTVGTYKAEVNGKSNTFNSTLCYTLEALISSSPFKLENESDVLNGIDKVYPNPAQDKLNIEYNSELDGSAQISIYDFTGRYIYSTTKPFSAGSNLWSVDLSSLRNGLYILQVVSNNQQNVIKFTIQK